MNQKSQKKNGGAHAIPATQHKISRTQANQRSTSTLNKIDSMGIDNI